MASSHVKSGPRSSECALVEPRGPGWNDQQNDHRAQAPAARPAAAVIVCRLLPRPRARLPTGGGIEQQRRLNAPELGQSAQYGTGRRQAKGGCHERYRRYRLEPGCPGEPSATPGSGPRWWLARSCPAQRHVRRLGSLRPPSRRHPARQPVHCPQAEPSEQAKRKAVGFAAYHALIDLFPTRRELFVAVMDRLATTRTRSAALAHRALSAPSRPARCSTSTTATGPTNSATWRLARMRTGPTIGRSTPRPARGPQPLAAPAAADGTVQRFLAPHWGLVAPSACTPAGSCRPRREASATPSRLPAPGRAGRARQRRTHR